MGDSQGDEHNEVAISIHTHSESSLTETHKYERKCYFSVGDVHTKCECPVKEEHSHKRGTKGYFSKVGRSKKTYKFNRVKQLHCSPYCLPLSLLTVPKACHRLLSAYS